MGKTYAVINQKGGVGKSTTAEALAAGLSIKEYAVLTIDLDPQGNTSYTAGVKTEGVWANQSRAKWARSQRLRTRMRRG